MNTGIKKLIKNFFKYFKYPKFLYPKTPADIFPKTPTSSLRVRARLFGLEQEQRDRNIAFNLGALHTQPHSTALKSYQLFLKYNPNHLGNWSCKVPKGGTEQLEYEIIQKMANLYHIQKQKVGGYITSGGTEGNIYSLWMGRSYLEKFCAKDTICLIKTDLTHYSIVKAGNICNINQFTTPLSTLNWNMNTKDLSRTIKNLYENGYRGFLLPLTSGIHQRGHRIIFKKSRRKSESLKKN